ncbi:FUSC family protein [uncultured Reyranella sp.]|uniref:FUSC family protein n=1 Tax=uncultured Reyranella sp. TaxID=735512 RepID=UPI002600B160|nr:FUSC family protein [uncultured Reyranella sp.]
MSWAPGIGRYGRAVVEDVREGARLFDRTLTGFWRELADVGTRPAQSRMGVVAAVSVVLTTTVALLMQLDAPWWAAISGYMSLMSTGAASVRRGILRLSGTIAGAVLGFVMARWLPYDQVALCLFLGGATMAGVIAVQVSPHGLAWLFMAITSSLVLLMSLNDPTQAFEIACYRTLDVAVGVSCAVVTAKLLQDWHAEPPAPAPGWRHLLGAQWPSVLHGFRAAISVVTVMIVWVMADLPDVGEMAVTIAVVMAAPLIADGGTTTRHLVAEKSFHRFMGCLLGGIVALACLALQVESFIWWLAMIGGVVWVGMHIQMGRHGIPYVGTQFAFVFVVTMVQGLAPPDSIMPGVDRFAGITGGLGILMIVSLLLWPSDEELKAEQQT